MASGRLQAVVSQRLLLRQLRISRSGVLSCSGSRQETPVTVDHIPDPYFINVISYSVAASHTCTDSSWRNFQSWKSLLYSSLCNIQIGRSMESERTLGEIKNMFS